MIPCCLLLVHFTLQRIRNGPFLLIVAVMSTLSRGVQPCTHANSTLCSMRYWLVPLVTGLFLACSACYWPVPWLFRLLLTCSLLVPLVTGLFRLFRVLETSVLSHFNQHHQIGTGGKSCYAHILGGNIRRREKMECTMAVQNGATGSRATK